MEERRGEQREENYMLATYPPLLAKRIVDWSVNMCVCERVYGMCALSISEKSSNQR